MTMPHDSHESHSADDYVKGEMDVKQHEHSFDLFVTMTKWGSLHISTVLLFLVILTCTKLGLFTALIAAGVLGIGGWFMLKSKPHH